jgi:hypothetical protein
MEVVQISVLEKFTTSFTDSLAYSCINISALSVRSVTSTREMEMRPRNSGNLSFGYRYICKRFYSKQDDLAVAFVVTTSKFGSKFVTSFLQVTKENVIGLT